MSVGLAPDKALIDSACGDVSRRLHTTLAQVASLKYFLDSKSTADLVALGYTEIEAAVLKSAYGDLDQLRTVYEGSASLAQAKDFRTFVRQVFGLGVTF